MAKAMEIEVNGKHYAVSYPADTPLLDVLRDELSLTGTKYGCGEGQCGACTVLLEGSAVRSCRLQVSAVVGKKITTIEGLACGEHLHHVQHAFLEAEAFQCGYCTSGMILSAVALLDHTNKPTDKQIISH